MSSLVNESTKLDVEVFGMAASNLHASAKPEAIDKYCPQQTSNSLSMPASLSESSQYVKSHHQDTHISHIAMDTIGQVAPRDTLSESALKGVWIPFERALDFANKEKITELLYPLFVHNIAALLPHPANQTKANQQEYDSVGLPERQSLCPSENSSNRPGLTRSHVFPTPPTSASSASSVRVMEASDNFAWSSAYTGIKSDLDNSRGKIPVTTPLGTPPTVQSPVAGPVDNGGGSPYWNHEHDHVDSEHCKDEHHGQDPAFMEATQNPGMPAVGLSPSLISPQSDSDSGSSDGEPGTLKGGEHKRLLLERLMGYFFELFSSCRSPGPVATTATSGEGEGTTSSRSTGSSNNTQQSSPPSGTGLRKPDQRRRKRAFEDRNEDGDDGDEKKPAKRTRMTNDRDTLPRKLACPYFKKEPGHFQFGRACSGPGWDTVHRIKEHLDRNHALPLTCVRCFSAFKSEGDRDAHMRSQEQCEIKEPPPRTRGVSPSQRDQLRCRPKGFKQMSEHQKWRHMYMILFPETEEADMPSPYYEYIHLHDPAHPVDPMVEYEGFLRREMPDRVRHQLEVRIEDALNPIEEALRGQIVDIVRDVQLELFQSFRSSLRDAPGASNHDQEAATIETASFAEQIQGTGGPDAPTLEPRDTGAGEPHELQARDYWEEQLQAYRPEPAFDLDFLGFDGELFDFSSLSNPPMFQDSAYGTLSTTTQTEHGGDPFPWEKLFHA
ncbi:hypothetical protein PG999_003876 [Apiospora kogelbergensis]|uniref:HTH APSES-type domain-containing protein n=1 Tax=Apiospora kogelbergensis TaxID=1337665 RepID=A0AAW0R4P3_9PEZI